MPLLLIHQAFAGPDEPGGTRHYELAQRVLKNGHHCSIVASGISYLTGQQSGQRTGLTSEQDCNGVRVLRVYTYYPALHRSCIWRIVSSLSFMVMAVWAGLRAGPVDLVMATSPPIF